MKKFIFPALLAFFILFNSTVYCAPIVDWYNGNITIIGKGAAPAETASSESRLFQRLAAEADTYKLLTDTISEIIVTPGVKVKDVSEKNKAVKDKIETLVKNSPISRIDYYDDNMAYVSIQIPVFGKGMLADIVLPAVFGSGEAKGTQEAIAETGYTGLIIEIATREFEPAFVPKIIDTASVEIFGKEINVSYAVEKGAVAYAASSSEAYLMPWRVGSKPIYVKSASILSKSNIVVSTQESYNILSSNERSKFLKNCKVVIVVRK